MSTLTLIDVLAGYGLLARSWRRTLADIEALPETT
jgi:hypothetical protein